MTRQAGSAPKKELGEIGQMSERLGVEAFSRVRGRKVRGLTKVLHTTFFSKFQAPRKKTKASSSKRLGTRVHREVELVLKKQSDKIKKMHAYSEQILRFLKRGKYTHMEPEVPLLCKSGKFLTYADLKCRSSKKDWGPTSKGGVVVISFKTGYNQGYSRGKKNCDHLPSDLVNSHKTHHQAQLAMEVACLERDYKIPVEDAFIIYAGFGPKKSLRIDAMEPWARDPQIIDTMFKALSDN